MNDTRFKKGNIPWNKGNKTGLKPVNGFKKGNMTWHTRPVGSERLDKDGYIIIKIANHKWVRKHRWIWEQKYGEISKDSVIIFADGNKENLDLDNLICVTRNELKILSGGELNKDDIYSLIQANEVPGCIYIKKTEEKERGEISNNKTALVELFSRKKL